MAVKRKLAKAKDELEAPDDAIRAEAAVVEASGEDAMECLRSAAEEQLRRYAPKIALALGKKAACGDLNSAKFLLQVTKEKAGPGRWRRRDAPSEAQRLAAEPQWQGPVPDLTDESSGDSSGGAGLQS